VSTGEPGVSRCAPWVIETTTWCATAGAFAHEQRREHLGDDAERAGCEIGRLDRWQRRRGVLEYPAQPT